MKEESKEARPASPQASSEPAPAWEACYRLTEDEWRRCYERTRAGASRLRNGIRLAVLALMFVGFAAYYIAIEPNGMSLFLAILCAALAVTVTVAPRLQARRAIRAAAASPRETRLREVEDGLAFGTGDGWLKQPFSALTLTAYPDMVIVGLPGDQRLAVPRRALDETAWESLCARATAPKKSPASKDEVKPLE